MLTDQDDAALADSFNDVPAAMRKVIRKQLPAMLRLLGAHTNAQQLLDPLQS